MIKILIFILLFILFRCTVIYRYLEYLNGLAPTQCPQSSGSCLPLFHFIHVCSFCNSMDTSDQGRGFASVSLTVNYSENLHEL